MTTRKVRLPFTVSLDGTTYRVMGDGTVYRATRRGWRPELELGLIAQLRRLAAEEVPE